MAKLSNNQELPEVHLTRLTRMTWYQLYLKIDMDMPMVVACVYLYIHVCVHISRVFDKMPSDSLWG